MSSKAPLKEFTDTKKFWKSPENRRQFVEWLGQRLSIQRREDWYRVRVCDFQEHGGRVLLSLYKNSVTSLLKDVFPDHNWRPNPKSVAKNYWNAEGNRLAYFDWLGKDLGIDFPFGWYNVRVSDVTSRGGGGILSLYDFSLAKALEEVYPEVAWEPWMFDSVPKGYWRDLNNQKKYLAWLGRELNFTELKDWYRVQQEDFLERKGGSLLDHYGWSQYKLLKGVFPHHRWQPWEFAQVPRGVWEEEDTVREYLGWVSEELNLSNEWNRVTAQQIRSLKGSGLLQKYGGLSALIGKFFPNQPLESPTKRQDLLYATVKTMFAEAKL